MLKHWEHIFKNLVFVDLETTGLSKYKDRIIEVAVVTIRGNKVVDRYHTLVNPGRDISQEISEFTGIKNEELKDKPSFAAIAPDLIKLINRGGVFVAHNAPFDYGFLEEAFKREEIAFNPPALCTVDLSRALYPGEDSHNLDSIIERHKIKIRNRHRALDDVLGTWYFFQQCNDLFEDYALGLVYDQIFRPATNKKTPTIGGMQMGLL